VYALSLLLLPPQHLITPHTLRSLKRHAGFLETADLSPIGKGLTECIEKFAKGSLTQAEVGAVVQEELSKTKAAELARTNRQQGLDGLFRREAFCMQMGLILWCVEGRRTMQKQR